MTVVLLRSGMVLWAVAVTWLVLPCSLGLYLWVGGGAMGCEGGVGRPRGVEQQYGNKYYYLTKFLLKLYSTLYQLNFVLM